MDGRDSIRQRMQEIHQTADARVSLSDNNARDTLSDSGCRILSIRQRMQEYLNKTADAAISLSDLGCRRLSIRQRMQEYIYQRVDAGDI